MAHHARRRLLQPSAGAGGGGGGGAASDTRVLVCHTPPDCSRLCWKTDSLRLLGMDGRDRERPRETAQQWVYRELAAL
jgi:hypothetical protein